MTERTEEGSEGLTEVQTAALSVGSQISWREYLNENQKLYSRLLGIFFIAAAVLSTYFFDPLEGYETKATSSPALSTHRPGTGKPPVNQDNLFSSYRLHTDKSYVGYHDAILSRSLKTEITVLVEEDGLVWTAFFYDYDDEEMYHATLYVDGSVAGHYRYLFTVWAPRTVSAPEASNVAILFPRERLTRIRLVFEPFESMTMTVIDASEFSSNLDVDRDSEGTGQDDEFDVFAVGHLEENPDHPFYKKMWATLTVRVPENSFNQRFFYYRILLGNYLAEFKSEISSIEPLRSFIGCVPSFYVNDAIKLRTHHNQRDTFAYSDGIARCNRTIGENFDVDIDEDGK